MKSHRVWYGFTLIEMLVVITIVGILLAMMIPVVGKMRERGREAKCVSNLKELHAAAMNYAFHGDDGYLTRRDLPYSRSWETIDETTDPVKFRLGVGWVHWTDFTAKSTRPNSPGRANTVWWGGKAYQSITTKKSEIPSQGTWANGVWGDTLWEYTGENLRVYVCPTFCRAEFAGTASPSGGLPNIAKMIYDIDQAKGVLRSYAMNSQCSGKTVGEGKVSSRMLLFADMSELATPVATGPQIASYGLRNNKVDGTYMYGCNFDGELDGTSASASYPREAIGTYHNGRGNAVFVDGHVASLLWSDTTNACAGR